MFSKQTKSEIIALMYCQNVHKKINTPFIIPLKYFYDDYFDSLEWWAKILMLYTDCTIEITVQIHYKPRIASAILDL